jgi:hypothetical protein
MCTLRLIKYIFFCFWSELDVILDWRQGLLTRRKLFRISAKYKMNLVLFGY